ncbi:MAG: PIN domain-containing protein [Candidatus Promineofilum sp.]|nr:PIN domain-containing protein [Promineifilum sp.]MCW5862615.1 PIN domain-containing protein [Anaerolineae bacterium]
MAIALLDTNVLVYIVDPEDPKKQSRAEEVMNALRANQNGRLSVQNLAEFFYTTTRKLKPPLSPSQAMEQIDRFQTLWPVFSLTPLIVTEAARAVRDYQLAYYDAQIWATARLNGVAIVLSEDFQTGRTLEGVQFINPFADDFRLEMLF